MVSNGIVAVYQQVKSEIDRYRLSRHLEALYRKGPKKAYFGKAMRDGISSGTWTASPSVAFWEISPSGKRFLFTGGHDEAEITRRVSEGQTENGKTRYKREFICPRCT
jgi:hypothetical protein